MLQPALALSQICTLYAATIETLRRGSLSLALFLLSSVATLAAVQTPTLAPDGGAYTTFQSIQVTCATPNALLRYTLDGSEPGEDDPTVASGGYVVIGEHKTLKVCGFLTGEGPSAVKSADYTITGQIACGGSHTLMLRANGTVWAMGANGSGQLGDGTFLTRTSPVPVSSLWDVVAVAAGSSHSLALKRDGTVWAWGHNSSGQCAQPFSYTVYMFPSPVQVSGMTQTVAIAAGSSHSVALSASGSVYTWGNGGSGQLGYGNTNNSHSPVAPLGGAKAIACGGGDHTLALMLDGTMRAWGYNYNGQVKSPAGAPVLSPAWPTGLQVTAISAGYDHSLALNASQQVLGWGANDQLQLGTGHGADIAAITGLSGVNAIAAGHRYTLVRLADGTLRGLGYNLNGQLGNGTGINAGAPVSVLGLGAVMTFAAGPQRSLAVRPDGLLWAWGDSSNGALGLPISIQKNIPIQLLSPELYEIDAFAASLHNVITHPDQSVWTWGNNTSGQLGLGDTVLRSAPLQIANLSALQVAAGSSYSLALRPDHTVAAWGRMPLDNSATMAP